MTDQTPDVPPGLVPGSQLAGYRLEEQIGHGGMAVVFRAYDYRLDRLVALKVLAPALAQDDAFRQRFIRESRAAAAVDDPHIIPVFEAGESGGVLFIAMRYVRGGDARSLVDRIGPLPAGRAVEIVTQTASALDAAHARGLVHRDVKPGNMLLDESQSAGRPDHVYLSDFGLSKASLAVAGLTATGQFLGTLDYIAPEQIEGRTVDGRTDQYSLACAAFELFCGAPPFRREDTVSVMYAQLNEPPPSLRSDRPDLGDELDRVMAKALAKAPADRYESCMDFATALRQALGLAASGSDSGPQAAHPPTQLASTPITPQAPQVAAGAGYDAPGLEPAGPGLSQRWPGPAGAGHTQAAQPSAGAGHAEAAQPPAEAGPTLAAQAQTGAMPGAASGPATARISAPSRTTEPGDIGTADLPGRSGRAWWRSPLPVAGLCAVVLLAGGGAFALSGHGNSSGHGHGSASRKAGNVPPLVAVSLPGCTTATARAATSTTATAATVTGDNPFGVTVTANGQYSFVTLGNSIAVLRDNVGLEPTPVQTIAASGASKTDALTHDGRFLVAAAGSGAVVVNVADAEQGVPDPISGALTSPDGKGAFGVLISANDEFVFVTLQGSDKMAVFNLRDALAHGFSAAFIGYVPLGTQPVGIASDGTWIYVANLGGTLSVINASKAETSPRSAVVKTVRAGCGTARVLLSADGQVLWVTARQSDALLAFSTARLRSDPEHALIAKVMVGEVPLGEVFVDNGTKIVIADSNLNSLPGATANLAVVDANLALAGKSALLGYVPSGLLPRELAVEPGGATLLVTNEDSHQLQALRIADLP